MLLRPIMSPDVLGSHFFTSADHELWGTHNNPGLQLRELTPLTSHRTPQTPHPSLTPRTSPQTQHLRSCFHAHRNYLLYEADDIHGVICASGSLVTIVVTAFFIALGLAQAKQHLQETGADATKEFLQLGRQLRREVSGRRFRKTAYRHSTSV